MKVWQMMRINQKYDDVVRTEGYTVDEMFIYDGRSHKEGWIPKKVKRMHPANKRLLGDLSWCTTVPVFSEEAIEKLWELIKNDIEVLPIDFDEKKYSLINVITLLNAIDYEKAEYKTFDDGRIMRFVKYSFKEKVIVNYSIFKIIDLPRSYVFVTDEFINAVKKYKLKGFSFKLVWDSEEE